jgi:protein-S-isoprenylcysteine O-methyltransferase Ste14
VSRRSVWGPVSFLLIGATLVGAFVLYRFVRDRADMPGTQLDERERQLRDRAWILAYQVLGAVVIVLGAAVVIPVLGFGNPVTIDASVATAVALSLGVLLPLLPAACLAWLEPDPVEEP